MKVENKSLTHQRTSSDRTSISSGSDILYEETASFGGSVTSSVPHSPNDDGSDRSKEMYGRREKESPFHTWFEQTGGMSESIFTSHSEPQPLLQANQIPFGLHVPVPLSIHTGLNPVIDANQVPIPNAQGGLMGDISSGINMSATTFNLPSEYSLDGFMGHRVDAHAFDFNVPAHGQPSTFLHSTQASSDATMQDVFDTAQPEEAWRSFMQDSGIEGLDRLEFGGWKWDF